MTQQSKCSPRSLGIVCFSGFYLLFQLGMIVSAHFREDKRFGFWMFAEASHFKAALYRELSNGSRERTFQGQWITTTPEGKRRIYRWADFVKEFKLGRLETREQAKTGIAVTLKYWRHALDFVLDRIPEDRETVRLHLKVIYSKAGGAEQEVTLSSKRREL